MTHDLAQFIELVGSRPDLRDALAEKKSADIFGQKCADLASQHGLRITAAEVSALLLDRALAWHQRHTL